MLSLGIVRQAGVPPRHVLLLPLQHDRRPHQGRLRQLNPGATHTTATTAITVIERDKPPLRHPQRRYSKAKARAGKRFAITEGEGKTRRRGSGGSISWLGMTLWKRYEAQTYFIVWRKSILGVLGGDFLFGRSVSFRGFWQRTKAK